MEKVRTRIANEYPDQVKNLQMEHRRKSVAGKSPERVPGHEAVTAGIACPEIADDVVHDVSGRLRSHH
jgi:hypothetical protein